VVVVAVAGCGGSNSNSSTAPTPTPPSAPFSTTDLAIGGGSTATQGRSLTVSYNGWLYDPTKTDAKGTRFDGNPNFTFTLGVGSVIRGWDMGVVGMRVGGQRRLIIPPELGYGGVAQGAIPANSTLVFEITLLNVN
jgi:FKBP-type peptidyl-prolyl cis-trans isomerase